MKTEHKEGINKWSSKKKKTPTPSPDYPIIGDNVIVDDGTYDVMEEDIDGGFVEMNSVVNVSDEEDIENNTIYNEGEVISVFEDGKSCNVRMYDGTIIEVLTDNLSSIMNYR